MNLSLCFSLSSNHTYIVTSMIQTCRSCGKIGSPTHSHNQFGLKLVMILLESEETLICSLIHFCRRVAPRENDFPSPWNQDSPAAPVCVPPEWKLVPEPLLCKGTWVWEDKVGCGVHTLRKGFLENKMSIPQTIAPQKQLTYLQSELSEAA